VGSLSILCFPYDNSLYSLFTKEAALNLTTEPLKSVDYGAHISTLVEMAERKELD
jgi:hypothetical protein